MIHPNRIWDAKEWSAVPPGLSAILKGGCAIPLPLGSQSQRFIDVMICRRFCGKPLASPKFPQFSQLLTSRLHCLGLWWLTPWALALGEETHIQINDCGFTWCFPPWTEYMREDDILQWQWPSYAAKWLSDSVLRYSPASKNPHGWFVGIWNDLRSYSLWYAPRCAPWTPISNWFYQAPPTTSWSFPAILLSSAELRQISSCHETVGWQLIGCLIVVTSHSKTGELASSAQLANFYHVVLTVQWSCPLVCKRPPWNQCDILRWHLAAKHGTVASTHLSIPGFHLSGIPKIQNISGLLTRYE